VQPRGHLAIYMNDRKEVVQPVGKSSHVSEDEYHVVTCMRCRKETNERLSGMRDPYIESVDSVCPVSTKLRFGYIHQLNQPSVE